MMLLGFLGLGGLSLKGRRRAATNYRRTSAAANPFSAARSAPPS
jgi:hypothetical protein